eukprot:CAMPEP_0201518504 /NCGR_PEP_ID=MMETSP0161_2-20130828/9339_1 /ASSEMBLY_ACC=CAM_ASM_000251 /TAXON_ID=180227 /ORGANISM="Neoparamoeba aestuarina, Strain SoJaBio B1-5/56/2" /LENGTH=245 /DNA_ID=CAMNT_0047916301 /DNA_START=141 /DNA_END=874 /DNA_ORIENTATION=-
MATKGGKAKEGTEKEEEIVKLKIGAVNNIAAGFARQMMKNERNLANGDLAQDLESLKGNCIYLPHFVCDDTDFSLLVRLSKELEANMGEGLIPWSKHLKHENPTFSPTFSLILEKVSDYFSVDIYATRMNFYRDGSDWKPFHHDSHAYGGPNNQKEDFTVGISLGDTRKLEFLHVQSQASFGFPQNNGDVFAFTSLTNKLFQHGVPKHPNPSAAGPRISIIAWGRRRELNERNSGVKGTEKVKGG